MNRDTASGFTLIELSIVLVVIGLVIGGVLAGRELIRMASIRGAIAEIESFDTAVNTFRMRYNALPGDMQNAASLFIGCGDNGNNRCNGNGNGIVDGAYAPHVGETCRFWQHMSMSGVLTNGAFTYVNQNAGYCYETEAPSTRYNPRGRWYVGSAHDLSQASYSFPNSKQNVNYYVMVVGPFVGRAMDAGVDAIMSPVSARIMDSKIDDSKPITGRMVAGNSGHGSASSAPFSPQNRYCLYSTNQYANPIDVGSWSYYESYDGDFHGCRIAVKTAF